MDGYAQLIFNIKFFKFILKKALVSIGGKETQTFYVILTLPKLVLCSFGILTNRKKNHSWPT